MYDQLEIHYEGHGFCRHGPAAKPLRLFVTCPAGLEAGADVRVSISAFHSFSRKWTFEDPFVEGGEGVMVIGHGLARDWRYDAGRRRSGRSTTGSYTSTVGLRLCKPIVWSHDRGNLALDNYFIDLCIFKGIVYIHLYAT